MVWCVIWPRPAKEAKINGQIMKQNKILDQLINVGVI